MAHQHEARIALSRFCDTTGDGTGTKDANGDYSLSPVSFKIKAGDGEVIVLTRLLICMSDSLVDNPDLYGAMAALTNGIVIEVRDAAFNLMYSLTDPDKPVKTVGQWMQYTFDVTVTATALPQGNDQAVIRWNFKDYAPPGIVLLPGWSFVIKLEDDFTGLVSQTFVAQGHFDRPEMSGVHS